MTETLKSIRDEIEKGCDEPDRLNPTLTRSCGDILFSNEIYYCLQCKAQLKILDRIKPLFEDVIEKKKVEDIFRATIKQYNYQALDPLCMEDGIELENVFKEELKKQLLGGEK